MICRNSKAVDSRFHRPKLPGFLTWGERSNSNVQSDSISEKVFHFFFIGFSLRFFVSLIALYMCVCIYEWYYPMIQLLINGNVFIHRTYPYTVISP